MQKRVIFALGGNAILTNDASATAQQDALKATAKKLANYVRTHDGTQLVITHGNGPQVGNLMLQQSANPSEKNPAMPLDTVGAMTQGEIGLWLANALNEELPNSDVAALLTRTLVDKNNPAFQHPTKPIGQFYTQYEVSALQVEHPEWQFVEDAGRGFRRVVASPEPIGIVEAPAVEALVNAGEILIAGGGGGVPVIRQDNEYIGVEAVIDKDFTSAKLAEVVKADELIILTAIDQAMINYGKENQEALGTVTVSEIKRHVDDNQFAAGSMKPKILALLSFVERTGKPAIMTSLDNVGDYEENGRATIIVPD